jgi:hypothetical protein
MKNLSASVQRPSIRYTYNLVELQQFLQLRLWRTIRRYDMCSSLHLFFSHQLSGLQCFQVWETARTLLTSRDGKCESISSRGCRNGAIVHRFCQHRWPAFAGMVGFRNHVGSAPLAGWVSPSSQRIAFARGTYLRLSYFLVVEEFMQKRSQVLSAL